MRVNSAISTVVTGSGVGHCVCPQRGVKLGCLSDHHGWSLVLLALFAFNVCVDERYGSGLLRAPLPCLRAAPEAFQLSAFA